MELILILTPGKWVIFAYIFLLDLAFIELLSDYFSCASLKSFRQWESHYSLWDYCIFIPFLLVFVVHLGISFVKLVTCYFYLNAKQNAVSVFYLLFLNLSFWFYYTDKKFMIDLWMAPSTIDSRTWCMR